MDFLLRGLSPPLQCFKLDNNARILEIRPLKIPAFQCTVCRCHDPIRCPHSKFNHCVVFSRVRPSPVFVAGGWHGPIWLTNKVTHILLILLGIAHSHQSIGDFASSQEALI